MGYRFYLLVAMAAMAIALASCGGGVSNPALIESPAVEGPVAVDQQLQLDSPGIDVEKEAAQWLPGFYVVTAGATYVDGVDYLFRLLGDNQGSYIWQLQLTNNHWQPKTINYAHNQRRYTFRIDQHGHMLWNSNHLVPKQPAGSLVLHPYIPHVYEVHWDGRDLHGNPIYGLVDATAIHRDAHNITSMTSMAWLNGVVGKMHTSEWPMFKHGPQRTSLSGYNGPQTHHVKWASHLHPSADYTVGASPCIGHDGTIYVGSGHWFYAFNPDGTLMWESGPHPGYFMSSPAVGPDGTIYVGFEGGDLYAFKPTGQIKWQGFTGGEVLSSPVIDDDGCIYVGSLGGFVTAFYPDGTVKWLYHGHPGIKSSPALGEDGCVYIGSGQDIVAIHPNGLFKWSYPTGGYVESSPAVGSDGTVYCGSDDGHLYAIDMHGNLKWSYSCFGPVKSSPAIDGSGTVFVGDEDGYMYAINQWGFPLWQYSVGQTISSSPSVGADGIVYFGCDNDNVYAFYNWGYPLWHYTTGGDVDSSAAISEDGCLYIVSDDNMLYAFGM